MEKDWRFLEVSIFRSDGVDKKGEMESSGEKIGGESREETTEIGGKIRGTTERAEEDNKMPNVD